MVKYLKCCLLWLLSVPNFDLFYCALYFMGDFCSLSLSFFFFVCSQAPDVEWWQLHTLHPQILSAVLARVISLYLCESCMLISQILSWIYTLAESVMYVFLCVALLYSFHRNGCLHFRIACHDRANHLWYHWTGGVQPCGHRGVDWRQASFSFSYRGNGWISQIFKKIGHIIIIMTLSTFFSNSSTVFIIVKWKKVLWSIYTSKKYFKTFLFEKSLLHHSIFIIIVIKILLRIMNYET